MLHGARLHDFGMIAMLAGLGVFASAYGCGSQGASKAHSGAANATSGAATTPAAKPAFATLERNVHPLARPENDLGLLDPNKRLPKLSLFFKLTPKQKHDRDALIAAQQDPTSPSYHKWLTPQDYAARFGASPDVIAKTTAWLASQGFEVQGVSPLGARVTFAGSVSTVQNAFQTELHRYQVGTETHFAMAKAPSIPSELADAVGGLYGTHDFYPRHAATKIRVATPAAACPTGDAYCSGKGIAPPDWANIYDAAKLYTTGIGGSAVTGAGVTIAIVGQSQLSQSDINAFRTRFGLPASTVTFTPVPGTGTTAAAGNGAGLEAALDVEWSGGIAQGATVNYVFAGSELPNEAEAAFYVIESNLAPIISESFGIAEAAYLQGGYMTTDGDLLEFYGSAASLEGITYIAASGDSGATTGFDNGITGLYVGMNASLPGVTGVGGTEFPSGTLSYSGSNSTQTAYSTSEEVWNESDNPSSKNGLGAGGGGISSLFTRPSYQSSLSTCPIVGSLPLAGVTASAMRQVPDVSFTAASGNNPVLVECELSTALGDCTGAGTGGESVIEIGGTSASAPSFAGAVALIEQATGGHRLGNINPTLYAIASSTPSAFHDITTGNNEIECTVGTDPGCGSGGLYGYAAATGYDCASGIGSADVYNLASAWATLTPTTTTLTPTPASTTLGSAVSLQATVKTTSSSANVTSGTVTFGFQTYLANGSLDDSWTLGTAPVSGGTATLSVAIPAGLVNPSAQYVDVVAMYGGNSTYLASTSAKSRVTFGTALTYCISPGTATVPPGDSFTYTATGGTGTTRYFIISDSTATVNTSTGAESNESTINETTGAFVAGTGSPGYVLVEGYDTSGAESWSWVTVGAPSEDAGTPWGGDSGILASGCGTLDAGTGSSGSASSSGTSSSGASSSSGTSSSGASSSGTSSSGASSSGTSSSGVSSNGGTSGGTSSGSTDDDGGSGNGESSSGGGTSSSSGCSVVATGSEKPSGGLLGAMLGLAALGARRRRRA